jgi:hypothetical protein
MLALLDAFPELLVLTQFVCEQCLSGFYQIRPFLMLAYAIASPSSYLPGDIYVSVRLTHFVN